MQKNEQFLSRVMQNSDSTMLSATLLERGYSFFCATCNHLHRAVSQGQGVCCINGCSGPPVGNNFPSYKGFMNTEIMASVCFACGDCSVKQVVSVKGRLFGVCGKHTRLLDRR